MFLIGDTCNFDCLQITMWASCKNFPLTFLVKVRKVHMQLLQRLYLLLQTRVYELIRCFSHTSICCLPHMHACSLCCLSQTFEKTFFFHVFIFTPCFPPSLLLLPHQSLVYICSCLTEQLSNWIITKKIMKIVLFPETYNMLLKCNNKKPT